MYITLEVLRNTGPLSAAAHTSLFSMLNQCCIVSEDMIADMMKPDFRNYIRDITSDKYGVDLEQAKTQGMHPVSSFRKLNID